MRLRVPHGTVDCSVEVVSFHGFVIVAGTHPDEPCPVAACDDLANFASHIECPPRLAREAHNSRTPAASKRGYLSRLNETWLIGRKSDCPFFRSEYPRNLAHSSHTEFENRDFFNFRIADQIGIGAAVTRRPLPHHRAYGSVHGGSSWLR